MTITELKNEGLDFQVKVKIPATNITDQVQKELIDLSKKVKMAGFRAGKVPINIVNKKYGESVKGDIIQKEINQSINNIVRERSLNIATDPKIEDLKAEEGQDIEFTLKFELMPKIDLPDFKNVSIEKPILKIEEKDIEEHLNKLIEFTKVYNKETNGKAAKGDQVTIDAIGYVDGEPFEGGKLADHKLVLGSRSFIDTFEDQLIGSKAGDEVEVKVTFPKQYHSPNLAGKPAKFEVKVKMVHKPESVEIDDEFAKKFNCETVDQLKEKIAKDIEINFEEPIYTIVKMRLFDEFEKLLNFEVPASLIEREYQILKAQSKQFNEADESLKDKSPEELEEYYKKISLRRIKIGLMLAEYIQVKGLQIEQNDIKDAVFAQARNFPGQEKAIIEYYQKTRGAIENLKGPILEEKAVKHILANELKVQEKKYTRKELEQFLDNENNREII